MKKSLLVCNVLVALLVIVGIASSRADSSGAQNCQDWLNNNLYRCQGQNTIIGKAEVCLQFVSPGVISSHFDLLEQLDFLGPDVVTVPYGCACGPVGVRSPEFNASSKERQQNNSPLYIH